MMTIVSRVRIAEGQEPDWDDTVRERLAAAREQPGFVSAQLCIPLDALNERVIIGTWETRADWERWHAAGPFRETRNRLDRVDEEKALEVWHEVLVEYHR